MKNALTIRTTLTALFLFGVALVAAAPSATAQPAVPAGCNTEPLGTPGGGVVGDVKRFGNPVIYGGCVLVLTVAGDLIVLAGDVVVLVVDAADLVCNFVTGNPCPATILFQALLLLIGGGG
jgi:hypothetical protein